MSHHAGILDRFLLHVLDGEPLNNLVVEMRTIRDAGISAEQVLSMLHELRLSVPNSSIDDRILEVMDYASGFCPVEPTIWPEPR